MCVHRSVLDLTYLDAVEGAVGEGAREEEHGRHVVDVVELVVVCHVSRRDTKGESANHVFRMYRVRDVIGQEIGRKGDNGAVTRIRLICRVLTDSDAL